MPLPKRPHTSRCVLRPLRTSSANMAALLSTTSKVSGVKYDSTEKAALPRKSQRGAPMHT
eukprot:scaffold7998_cov417-Prasinococcus_capsulatus_cf.AAC.18